MCKVQGAGDASRDMGMSGGWLPGCGGGGESKPHGEFGQCFDLRVHSNTGCGRDTCSFTGALTSHEMHWQIIRAFCEASGVNGSINDCIARVKERCTEPMPSPELDDLRRLNGIQGEALIAIMSFLPEPWVPTGDPRELAVEVKRQFGVQRSQSPRSDVWQRLEQLGEEMLDLGGRVKEARESELTALRRVAKAARDLVDCCECYGCSRERNDVENALRNVPLVSEEKR
jgi:hypothetical protein